MKIGDYSSYDFEFVSRSNQNLSRRNQCIRAISVKLA
jgi:hypothetical protein